MGLAERIAVLEGFCQSAHGSDKRIARSVLISEFPQRWRMTPMP
jgi:hypothetical protein